MLQQPVGCCLWKIRLENAFRSGNSTLRHRAGRSRYTVRRAGLARSRVDVAG